MNGSFGVDRTVNLTTYILSSHEEEKNTFFVQPLLLNARRRRRVWKTISIVETYNTTERWLDWRRQHETLWLFDNREKRTLFFSYRRRASSSPLPCCVCYVWWKKNSLCAAAAVRGLVTSLEITRNSRYTHIFVKNWLEAFFKWVYDQVQSPKLSSNISTISRLAPSAKQQQQKKVKLFKAIFCGLGRRTRSRRGWDEGPILWCDSCIFFHT